MDTAWVREVMGGQGRLAELKKHWEVYDGDDHLPVYNSEGELELSLSMMFKALLQGLPRGMPAGMYPEREHEAVKWMIGMKGNYNGGGMGQFKFDIALLVLQYGEEAIKEDVFGFAEVKTEMNMVLKEAGIEETISRGNVELARWDSMSLSDRMLVQVFMQMLRERNAATIVMGHNRLYLMELDWATSTLLVDGPYFRFPKDGQEAWAFTPVDAMKVVARMYKVRQSFIVAL
ncbi:hypothetical protein BN946_scf184382.g2 [Trametes cinnabarina]|uniref:Uncharacterized protein n=1 Tax=Pycnoporus cinnabarinus TaxID=5643 RepID=A0A060S2V4_PYCCI|nr:hypothetical protein BN946_scf184382.g2 [Trametes cinnabarina]